MRILYRQPQKSNGRALPFSTMAELGIEHCYLKEIDAEIDSAGFAKKSHSHTGYEVHLLETGSQVYETEDGCFSVEAGQFLLIPPNKKHQLRQTQAPMRKYGLIFSLNLSPAGSFWETLPQRCVCKEVPSALWESIRMIRAEREHAKQTSRVLIEGRTLEGVLLLLRTAGAVERKAQQPSSQENDGLEIAKQYIQDNLHTPLQVADVAAYCYVSTKQLTRLFARTESISPAAYIKREKIRYIQALLADASLSIREISERCGFPNEYYFNTFFKRYYGMPPGQYRKMI